MSDDVEKNKLPPIPIEGGTKVPSRLGEVKNLTDLNLYLESKNKPYMDPFERLEKAYFLFAKGGSKKVPPNSEFVGMSYDEFLNKFDDTGITRDVEIFKEKYGNNPIYRGLNNVQIADKMYEQLNNSSKSRSGKNYGNYTDFINLVAPKPELKLDTNLGSPFYRDFKKKKLEAEGRDIEPYSTLEIMNLLGLNPDNKSVSLLSAKSFGTNKEEGLNFLQNYAQEIYGQNATISFDERFDSISLLKPDGTTTLLGKPDTIDMSDFSQYLGATIPIIADILVSSGAFYLGGLNPAGGLTAPLASGAASGLIVPPAEAVRFAIGYKLFGGKDDSKSFAEAFKQKYGEDKYSALDANITGGIDFLRKISSTALGPIKNISVGPFKKTKVKGSDIEETLFDSKTLNPLATETVDEVIEAVSRLQKIIQEKNGLGHLRLNLAQLVGDQKLLGRVEDILKKPNKYKDSFGQLVDNIKETDKALLNLLNDAKNGFTPDALRLDGSTNIHKTQLSEFIAKEFDSIGYKNLNDLRFQLENAESAILSKTTEIGDGVFIPKGTEIQNSIVYLDEKAFGKTQNLYGDLAKQGDSFNVNTDLIEAVLAKIKKAGAPQGDKAKKQFNPKSFIDLENTETASDLIRNLRNFRLLRKEGNFRFVDKKLLDEYENAISKQLKNDLLTQPGGSGFIAQKQIADESYKAYKEKFPTFIRGLIQKNEGRMPDGSNLFTNTFKVSTDKGNRQNMDLLYDVLKDDKTALLSYQESINSFYKSKVFSNVDGKLQFNKKAHDDFITKYKYSIEKFFGKEGSEAISKIGGFNKEITALRKEYNEVFEEFVKISPKATAFNPREIYSFWQNGDLDSFQKSINLINKTGNEDMLKSLQMIVADDIFATIKPPRPGDKWGAEKFATLLDGLGDSKMTPAAGSKARLLEVLYGGTPKGQAYLQNLKDMKIVLNRMTLQAPSEKDLFIGTTTVNFLRAWIAPPLTRAGRVMTGALGFAQSGFDRGLAELIVQPDALEQLAKLRKINTKNPKFGDILNDVLHLNVKWTPEIEKFFYDKGTKIIKGTLTSGFGTIPTTKKALEPNNLIKQTVKDAMEDDNSILDNVDKQDIDNFKIKKNKENMKNNQSKLSLQPINVAQMNNMAPVATDQARNQARNQAPMVLNQNRGIASLSESPMTGANLARMRAIFPTGIV